MAVSRNKTSAKTRSSSRRAVVGNGPRKRGVGVGSWATLCFVLLFACLGTYLLIQGHANPKYAADVPDASVGANVPIVTITSPQNTANIGNAVTIAASGTGTLGVNHIEIYVDGQLLASTYDTTIHYVWNAQKAATGSHQITVMAYDASGDAGKSTVFVTK